MTAKTLRGQGIWAEAWAAIGADAIRARLACAINDARARGALEPTLVVILAPWLETDEVESLALYFPDVTFTVFGDPCDAVSVRHARLGA